jgi:hypothetical protein
MLVGVILGIMVMVFFAAWPVWKWIETKPVSDSVRERTRAAVEKYPELQPAWDIAMQDDVLTGREARIILDAAEKLGAKK